MKLTLFDLDGTLLPTDSDHAFGDFVIGLGWADAADHKRRNDQFYADYQAGRLDMTAYVDFASAPWRDRSPRDLDEAMQRFVREVMQPQLHPAALALVRQHQTAGDLIAIVTATNDFVTRPIARLFGVDVLIATDLAHLMPLFDRLDEFALSLARPVTVPLLRRMLAEAPGAPAVENAHPPERAATP